MLTTTDLEMPNIITSQASLVHNIKLGERQEAQILKFNAPPLHT